MAKPKFIADEDTRRSIVDGIRLRELAVDIVTARESGTLGMPDPRLLVYAAQAGRVLVSSDRRTMPRHFWKFRETQDCPGLIIVSQAVEVSRAIDELVRIWTETSPRQLSNQIRWVKSRI